MGTSGQKNQDKEQDSNQQAIDLGITKTEAVYFTYRLLYHLLIFIGFVAALLLFDVGILQDYSMRETMLYTALTGIGVMAIERIIDFKLKKWGVIS